MGGIVSGIVGGIFGNKGDKATKNATSNAAAAQALANDYAEKGINFSQEQLDAWTQMYGDLEKNIADYYTNMDGKLQTSKELQILRTEYAESKNNINRFFAQNGLSGSGLEGLSRTMLEVGGANRSAEIRANQDQKVAEQQANFFANVANPNKQVAISGLSNAYSNAASIALNGGNLTANTYNQAAQRYQNMGSAFLSQGIAGTENMILDLIAGKLQANATTGAGAGGSVGAQGSSLMNQAGRYFFSDRKLKDNIELVGTLGDVNFYTWDWNETACDFFCLHGKSFGVIADEVAHIPNAVKSWGQFDKVDYTAVVEYLKGLLNG